MRRKSFHYFFIKNPYNSSDVPNDPISFTNEQYDGRPSILYVIELSIDEYISNVSSLKGKVNCAVIN